VTLNASKIQTNGIPGATFSIPAFYAPPLKDGTCSFSHHHAVAESCTCNDNEWCKIHWRNGN